MEQEALRGLRGLEWLRLRHAILHGGDGMVVERLPSGAVWRHCGALTSGIEELLSLHAVEVSAGRCFKNDRKRCITSVRAEGRGYIVKEFRRILRGCPFSPDRRSWLCGHRLVGAVGYLGWYRDRERGVIVMEDAGDHNLCFREDGYEYALAEHWFSLAVRMVARLHDDGVYHADVKPHNFVTGRLRDRSSGLTLIDCDDVRVPFHFSRRLVLKNLGQLIGGLSYSIGDSADRHRLARRMYEEYCSSRGVSPLRSSDRPFWESYCCHLYPEYSERCLSLSAALFG